MNISDAVQRFEKIIKMQNKLSTESNILKSRIITNVKRSNLSSKPKIGERKNQTKQTLRSGKNKICGRKNREKMKQAKSESKATKTKSYPYDSKFNGGDTRMNIKKKTTSGDVSPRKLDLKTDLFALPENLRVKNPSITNASSKNYVERDEYLRAIKIIKALSTMNKKLTKKYNAIKQWKSQKEDRDYGLASKLKESELKCLKLVSRLQKESEKRSQLENNNQEEVTNYANATKDLEVVIQSLRIENEGFKADLHGQLDVINKLQFELEDCGEQMKRVLHEKRELTSQLHSEQNSRVLDNNASYEKIEFIMSENEILKLDIQMDHRDMQLLKEELQEKSNMCSRLGSELNSTQRKFSKLESEVHHETKKMKQLKLKLKEYKEKEVEYTKVISDLMAKNSRSSNEYDELKLSLGSLHNQKKSLDAELLHQRDQRRASQSDVILLKQMLSHERESNRGKENNQQQQHQHSSASTTRTNRRNSTNKNKNQKYDGNLNRRSFLSADGDLKPSSYSRKTRNSDKLLASPGTRWSKLLQRSRSAGSKEI